MKIPRIMLAAPNSGSGKTLITCGLLQALKNKGRNLASFKCGPDYIDPLFHTRVLGVPSRNLDTYFSGRELTRTLFGTHAQQADLAVMEGVMGFYDGVAGVTLTASSWELADVTDTSVILVVNMRGMSLSVAALIQGFMQMQPESHIGGVILNQTSEFMCRQLEPVIKERCGIPVLGFVPKVTECVIESRHLGLVTPAELTDLQERIEKLAEILTDTLDLEAIIHLAEDAPDFTWTPLEQFLPREYQEQSAQVKALSAETLRIGVAKDEAFCFYYEDNLDLLRMLGAETVFFSPLHDQKLPENLQGLLIGGGYPELYAKQLSENESMRRDIREKITAGMPYLAECGGFMYLHESMEDMQTCRWPMAGVLKGNAYYTGKLGRFGYVELTAKEDQMLCKNGERIKAHEFHYFDSTENGAAFYAIKPKRSRGWECIQAGNVYAAGFPHLYYYSNPRFAANFVEACRRYDR
ncbi:cobyrinate a,c-diamide synthase [uncultured Eubacterium sp.]|uniref:cobyrinate a,c-diamide synthase n=1 Tax=uncultured Eubacterium sp. TaxID=165185 RepID=UPI0025E6848D|nr:cobyrinate a,c-diamide synthase [uncultured Eubacterium sp.]